MAAKVLAKGKMGNHRCVSNGETLVSATAKTTALVSTTIRGTKKAQAKARMANTANQGPARQTVRQVRARTRVEKEADPLHPKQRLSRINPSYVGLSSWGKCKYGDKCKYHHNGPCKFHSKGKCTKGADCIFGHGDSDVPAAPAAVTDATAPNSSKGAAAKKKD
jgi:hypothetical protein